MAKLRLYFIFLLFIFLNACIPPGNLSEKTFTDEGNVILYLQPMPQEASRLRFVIDGIFAVRDDGSKIPLSLSIDEIKGADLTQLQKRLATGRLPEGLYTGISIKITKAFMQGEEGESALFVPEEPIAVEHLFKRMRRETLTLFLSFGPSGAVTGGVSFTPVFSLMRAGRGPITLKGYVSNSDSNNISVFDKKTMQVTSTMSTGKKPMGMVLDRLRARAYVAASGDNAIGVIDIAEGKIIDRIKLNFGDEPVDLALTPDGRTLVSVNRGSNTVSLIDALSKFEVRRIKVGERPVSAVVDPSGLRAYIMNSLSNSVSVVDLTQNLISAALDVEGAPVRGAFNRNGDRLYVISTDSPYLFVIDPSRLIVTDKIFIGMGAVSIKIHTRTGLIFVGKKAEREISIIDSFALALIDAIPIDGHAAFMTIDEEENTLFVTLPEERTLLKVNFTGKKIIATIEVGEAAYAVVVMGEK